MNARRTLLAAACPLLLAAPSSASLQATTQDAPAGRPVAVIDLATREGTSLVKGEWRYADARIVEVDHRYPGPDLRPSGAPNRTHDIAPQAGAADFDDSSWEVVAPEDLGGRRSTGKLCFGWFRTRLTVPEKVGKLDPTGHDAVLEVVVDDYAEIWVDGKLPFVLGQAGGRLVKGWNAPNRVLLGRDIRPGQTFQIAVFAMNAPVSSPPGNYVWIRSATLDFHPPGQAGLVESVEAEVLRVDPALDGVLPGLPVERSAAASATGSPPAPSLAKVAVERIARGFIFTEGPVWSPEGYLLFSDPNANAIYRWAEDGQVSVFRTKSGYAGLDIGEYSQPGSNGLAFDAEGRLTVCEHGRRRVIRLEKNGVVTVLADRYEGKRLSSPNDLVYRSDGALYFTDPPFGLPRFHEDPRRELSFNGVFCLIAGKLLLVSTDLRGPNGVALSPDEKYLYVTNWDERKKVVVRYEPHPDGTLANGRIFIDMTGAPGEEALDGLEVDPRGNLYVSGPGGIWVVSPRGRHLGTIRLPELPANFAWGDGDGKTLYMTARTGIYRMRLGSTGTRG